MRKIIFGLFLAYLMFACRKEKTLFLSLDDRISGVNFENILTPSNDFNILDYLYFYNGGGVAVGDINNDGLQDVFFSGNQVDNQLYLNKGNLKFEDISHHAGIEGNSDWKTGAVMGDINNDGFLDIYVCAVVGLKGLTGHNELFINNGDNTFTESSLQYALDYATYSSSAVFLDYDLDEDLDIYLLNHSVHTPESFGKSTLRNNRKYETGDKLLRNDGLKFTDVSEEAGIFGGTNGYGLGVAISDFNLDGYPDIFVGNDFHEDDYYYLNNGDGTFSESLKKFFTYTSRFSMGNDVADINHDGRPDLFSLDMLPEDEIILKTTESDESYHVMRLRHQHYGYYYQFSRNMLQINQENGKFIETALLSGVEATDWSWSILFADYDLDGHQDIYVSNGIPKRPNDLDFIRFVSNEQVKNTINTTKIVDQKALNMMPSGATKNYIFKGKGDLFFENMSNHWIPDERTYSTATAWADLDNDGDLDIITNNINAKASLLINQSKLKNFLKIKFDYKKKNPLGIGTKAYSYHAGLLQFKELYYIRGFQSSSEPLIHFGYDHAQNIDSLIITWPNGNIQKLFNIKTNQTLLLSPKSTDHYPVQEKKQLMPLFVKIENGLGINYKHIEDKYVHFDRQKLIPYQVSDRGPAVAIGDIDGDGQYDIFFGSSKFKSSQIFVQKHNKFHPMPAFPLLKEQAIKEDVTATIADFDNNGYSDIIIGTGGADFFKKSPPLTNTYLAQDKNGIQEKKLPITYENTSVILPCDYDQDGDLDLFIGNHSITSDFGRIPDSYILQNHNGNFEVVENPYFEKLGMVTDASWSDYDQDGDKDLIVVGEWMTPKFFENNKKELIPQHTEVDISGLWQSIFPYDIDRDGDVDYLLGNWGLNSKFEASHRYPMKMYYADFDHNESTETILAIAKQGKYYPLETFDQLSNQLVELRKTYPSYQSFAGKTIEEIFEKTIKNATLYQVNTLATGYLKNENNTFVFVPFDENWQLAPVRAFVDIDIDHDGRKEVIAAGNYFGVKPYHGRLASFPGRVLFDENKSMSGIKIGLDFLNKQVRALNVIEMNEIRYLLVTLNNQKAEVYRLN